MYFWNAPSRPRSEATWPTAASRIFWALLRLALDSELAPPLASVER